MPFCIISMRKIKSLTYNDQTLEELKYHVESGLMLLERNEVPGMGDLLPASHVICSGNQAYLEDLIETARPLESVRDIFLHHGRSLT